MELKPVVAMIAINLAGFLTGWVLFGLPEPATAVVEPERGRDHPQTWKFLDDYEAPKPVLQINSNGSELMDIVIYGRGVDGKPIAIIHPDGHVTLNGDPNEAAKRFWQAIGQHMPKCDCNKRR